MPHNPSCAAANAYCSTNSRITKGYCDTHYYRDSKYGSPYGGRTPPGAPMDFLDAAVASTSMECILWPYATGGPGWDEGAGYGKLSVDGKIVPAHREALRRAKGEPPHPYMDACHDPVLCTSSLCINPNHLRWDTREANMADMDIAGTRKRGEDVSYSSLTREQVRAIFVDPRPYAEIAAEYGIHKVYVGKIKRREKRAEDTADLTPVIISRSGDNHWRRVKARREAEERGGDADTA